jgi:hypothetical protein
LLVSEDLLELMGTRAADGRLLSYEWGEPDDNGWYTATVTATDDGKEVVDRAEIARLRKIEEANSRTRDWIALNLSVWTDDEATSDVSKIVCDVLRKVRNVMDTGEPLRAALASETP